MTDKLWEKHKKKVKNNRKRNEKYIIEFEKWLNEKGLVEKTITKHVYNVDLYINEYLNYYDIIKVENGMNKVFDFLNKWFIEECLWATKNSLKENAVSIKRFYKYMCEKNYISTKDYNEMCNLIKDNMSKFLEQVDFYYSNSYCDPVLFINKYDIYRFR